MHKFGGGHRRQEIVIRMVLSSFTDALSHFRIIRQARQNVDQSCLVALGEKEASSLMLDHFRRSTDDRADDRYADSHGFHNRDRCGLAKADAGQNESIIAGQSFGDLVIG